MHLDKEQNGAPNCTECSNYVNSPYFNCAISPLIARGVYQSSLSRTNNNYQSWSEQLVSPIRQFPEHHYLKSCNDFSPKEPSKPLMIVQNSSSTSNLAESPLSPVQILRRWLFTEHCSPLGDSIIAAAAGTGVTYFAFDVFNRILVDPSIKKVEHNSIIGLPQDATSFGMFLTCAFIFGYRFSGLVMNLSEGVSKAWGSSSWKTNWASRVVRKFIK